MSRKVLPAGLAIIAAGALTALAGCGDGATRAAEDRAKGESSARHQPKPLVIKGFMYTAVDKNGRDTIEADQLQIRPRRLMAFNVKSVNEVLMTNARLVVDSRPDATAENRLFDFEKAVPSPGHSRDVSGASEALGRVTRLVLDRTRLEIIRNGKPILSLQAAAGVVEKSRQEIRYFNALLEDERSERFVKAREIVWDRAQERFTIPGKYMLGNGDVSRFGESIQIDHEFARKGKAF